MTARRPHTTDHHDQEAITTTHIHLHLETKEANQMALTHLPKNLHREARMALAHLPKNIHREARSHILHGVPDPLLQKTNPRRQSSWPRIAQKAQKSNRDLPTEEPSREAPRDHLLQETDHLLKETDHIIQETDHRNLLKNKKNSKQSQVRVKIILHQAQMPCTSVKQVEMVCAWAPVLHISTLNILRKSAKMLSF